MKKFLGKPADSHLEGFKLKKADILLEHTRHSFWGWLIRVGTGNYWNHALMVYDAEETSEGCQKVMVVDPRMSEINIRDISDYFKELADYDVGVKRLEEEWFQKDGIADDLLYRTAVATLAVKETGAGGGSTAAGRTLRKMLRELIISYRFLLRKIPHPKSWKKTALPAGKQLKASAYACSGIVQWSYFRGIAQMIGEGKLDKSRLEDVIFDKRLGLEAADYDLLSITPAALAKSDKLSWKYIIKDGEVWEVSSEEDVEAILKGA